ncbi:MAG: imidazole glycerol phosphate synthase subunit HisH [Planctomycetota bacterium]
MIAIIETSTANLASVETALARLGRETVRTIDPSVVESADYVVLPGVGQFLPARTRLRETGVDRALVDRVRAEKPTLGVCLGFQLFFEGSDESQGEPGLGLLDGRVVALDGPRSPHMGWANLDDRTWGPVYFAHTFGVRSAPGAETTWADCGGPFVAAVRRGALLGCQFHPELSGSAGRRWLTRWLAANRREGA